MNKLEEFVYHLVYKNPTLKLAIRNLYQCCYDLLPRKKDFFGGSYSFKEGFFLGFHDTNPFSEDESMVLANEAYFDGRMPNAGESVGVGFFDFADGELAGFHKQDDSYAWNWHKGCRLQWLSGEEMIFNTAANNKVVSNIINLRTGEKIMVHYPIDTVYGRERVATTFSYERLQFCMPGYGYPYCDEDSFLNEGRPRETGLFLLDLSSSERTLLISLADLANQVPEEYRDNHIHYVTHTEFSKDGRYISFLHRWIREDGTNLKRWTRLMVYDRVSKDTIELPTQYSGSHYVWNDNNQIIGSFIINNKSCHLLFDMNDITHPKVICGDFLNQDGHQSFIETDRFVTDTYPDKRRMAKLYLVDIKNNEARLIADTYSPKSFQSNASQGHIACDLHPTVSSSGKYVCFDCPRTGKRGLYVMEIE